jgi:hypothetical protein
VPTASTSSPGRSARRSAAPPAATSPRAEIVELLRQRSRPYLFSNSVAPPIVAASLPCSTCSMEARAAVG